MKTTVSTAVLVRTNDWTTARSVRDANTGSVVNTLLDSRNRRSYEVVRGAVTAVPTVTPSRVVPSPTVIHETILEAMARDDDRYYAPESLSRAELVAECRSRDLSERGTNAELWARIGADMEEEAFCHAKDIEDTNRSLLADMDADAAADLREQELYYHVHGDNMVQTEPHYVLGGTKPRDEDYPACTVDTDQDERDYAAGTGVYSHYPHGVDHPDMSEGMYNALRTAIRTPEASNTPIEDAEAMAEADSTGETVNVSWGSYRNNGVSPKEPVTLEKALQYAQVMSAGCQAGIGLVAATGLAEASLGAPLTVVAEQMVPVGDSFATKVTLSDGTTHSAPELDYPCRGTTGGSLVGYRAEVPAAPINTLVNAAIAKHGVAKVTLVNVENLCATNVDDEPTTKKVRRIRCKRMLPTGTSGTSKVCKTLHYKADGCYHCKNVTNSQAEADKINAGSYRFPVQEGLVPSGRKVRSAHVVGACVWVTDENGASWMGAHNIVPITE